MLTISEKYWPLGGAEIAIHYFVRQLRQMGLDTTVLTGMEHIEKVPGVDYLWSRHLKTGTSPKMELWARLAALGECFDPLMRRYDVIYIPRIAYPLVRRAKRLGRVVVVHLFDYQPVSFTAAIPYPYESWAAKGPKDEILWTYSNESYLGRGRAVAASLLTPLRALGAYWIDPADYVICESWRQAEIMGREIPGIKPKIRVIPDPLPDVKYNKESRPERIFLFLGGDQPIKGLDMILSSPVVNLLRRTNCRVVLAKVSSARTRELIESLNTKYGHVFVVHDRLDYREVLALYSRSLALLFPSSTEEPLPSVVLEAMLAGVIPVASRVGGVPEIVKGTYAERTLFQPGSPEDMAAKMESVISLSQEEVGEIGPRLREAVMKRYNSDEIVGSLERIFL